MRKVHASMLLCLLMAACSHAPMRSSGEPSELDRWVGGELAPYLAEQLSSHPRFKGEPVLLLRVQDQDIQPVIDGLSESIRDRIRDALLGTRGVNLPWQPKRRGQRHHRRLADLDCSNIREASYYIGIEINAVSGGRHRVALRALDVRARQWVGGVSKSWEGRLTGDELDALGQLRADEALRGLRALPFQRDQIDMAADYLANNLSCLLRQGDEESLIIHPRPIASQQPDFSGLPKLVGNNLSRYREVRVTEKTSEAGFTLTGEAHHLGGGLYQVWLVLQPQRSGLHLAGMDTATYITAEALGRAGLEPAPAPAPALVPAIARMSLSDEDAFCRPAGSNGGCRNLQVELDRDQELFVIVHSRDAGLARLLPGACATPARQVGGRQLYQLSGLDPAPSTYYGIAVRDRRLQQILSRHLQQLPDACNAAQALQAGRMHSWLDRLDRIIQDNRGRIAWVARRSGG